MRYYCTFFIRSDDGDAPSKILVSDVLGALDFDDNESVLNLASAERWRAAGFVRRNDLPRFKWFFDTREAVDSDEIDPLVHVSWLLSHLRPGISLAEATENGIETWLGFYWGGSGTGGGPFISVRLAELLARHQICLNVGFYYEEYENGTDAA
ncbi:hypothetical protein HZ993_02160 [Rhodoferax sp. AJA081-3]|uniref:hypothetical protein n=1 Tax=Rhodoferax sp. AJA081-3 TaxID=2752316 RepID=UPI001AE07FCB|nr:hypothetical protein [Rhodoferax sp. AJA081-3]QTN28679.1 hypothetical protein HZ993_02160 [Rhodoferax sp. AJA081-3]